MPVIDFRLGSILGAPGFKNRLSNVNWFLCRVGSLNGNGNESQKNL